MSLIARYLSPIAADLIGLILALLLLPLLRERFQLLGFGNSVIVGMFFALFCLGVYGIKKLKRDGIADIRVAVPILFEKRTLAVFGVLFALAISIATAYVARFLDSVVDINRNVLDEPTVTIYLLLTPASWFGIALIYMLLLSSPTKETVAPGSGRDLLVSVAALSAVNLMAVGTTGIWQAFWTRFGTPDNNTLFILLNAGLYFLLYGPPRLLYLAKNPRLVAVVTFVPLLVYLAAVSLP